MTIDGRNSTLAQVELKAPGRRRPISRSSEPGNVVHLDGAVYTAREGVYRKVLEEGTPLPDGLTRAGEQRQLPLLPGRRPRAGRNVQRRRGDGDRELPVLEVDAALVRDVSGAKMVIGKGGMSGADYRDHFVPAGAVYLTTVGYGTGALLGRGIRRVRDVYWLDELGIAQAMWVFEVERFGPFLVDSDLEGNSLFEEQGRLVKREPRPRLRRASPPGASPLRRDRRSGRGADLNPPGAVLAKHRSSTYRLLLQTVVGRLVPARGDRRCRTSLPVNRSADSGR